MLENFNLKKYADDEEIQQKLSDHFNEPAIVGNPSKTLSLLKGFNKQYSSIKLLLKEIGVGEQGDTEESKEAISKIIKSNEALQTYQHKAEQRKQFREEQERKKLREQERLEEARKKRREEKEREELAKYYRWAEEFDEKHKQFEGWKVGKTTYKNPSSGLSYSERRQ